jgi:hypothetical protein
VEFRQVGCGSLRHFIHFYAQGTKLSLPYLINPTGARQALVLSGIIEKEK